MDLFFRGPFLFFAEFISDPMIYDFYENFINIYPLPRKDIITPDREVFGYYWEFEDYLIEGERGNGLTIAGFLINVQEDLSHFKMIFDRAFRITTINSIISTIIPAEEDFVIDDLNFLENYKKNSIKEIEKEFKLKLQLKKDFFGFLDNFSGDNRIWISSNPHWNKQIQTETEKFWKNEVRIITFPDHFSIMRRKDVWEESYKLDPMEFNENWIWEDLAFRHPSYVKYIDENVVNSLGLDFLDQSHSFGLI